MNENWVKVKFKKIRLKQLDSPLKKEKEPIVLYIG